jgi:hypothetical protein
MDDTQDTLKELRREVFYEIAHMDYEHHNDLHLLWHKIGAQYLGDHAITITLGDGRKAKLTFEWDEESD